MSEIKHNWPDIGWYYIEGFGYREVRDDERCRDMTGRQFDRVSAYPDSLSKIPVLAPNFQEQHKLTSRIAQLESSVAFYERECKRWSDLHVESHVYEKRIVELETENKQLRDLLAELSSAAKAYGDAEYFDDDEELENTAGPRLIAAIEAADKFTKGAGNG